MARSKSQLKKLAAKKRAEEHEANRKLKAQRKQNVMMGLNEDGSLKGAKPIRKSIYVKEFKPMHTEGYRRPSPEVPSYDSGLPHNTARKERQVYSGDYIVGIATMHKSNLVPVGRGDDPKAFATMRRN